MSQPTKSRGPVILLLAVLFLVATVGVAVTAGAIGYGIGQQHADRQLYNLAIRDGRRILVSLEGSAETVRHVSTRLASVRARARGDAGDGPEIDRDTLEALAELDTPFAAEDFSRTRYNAFKPRVVNDLLLYAFDVAALWEQLHRAAAMARGLEGPHDPRYPFWLQLVEDAMRRVDGLLDRQSRLIEEMRDVAALEEVQA